VEKEQPDIGLFISELDPFDKNIRAGEVESIPDRWDFGRVLEVSPS